MERKSRIFRRKEWLLKDDLGKPVVAGFNPVWKGHFFALDPTHPGVQDYIRERISTLKEMGFQLFKMDYLYSLALKGRTFKENLSRREVMEDGLKLLRESCEGASILGCGAPLLSSPAYDFLRIGPDVSDRWENKIVRLAGHYGGVEAKNCLRNTISRFFLDGKCWLSDPDVLILRKGKLNFNQRRTLILSNFFLSHFLFFSDPLDEVPEESLNLLRELQPYLNFSLNEGQPGDYFTFKGETEDLEVQGFINLNSRSFRIDPEEGFREVLNEGNANTLEGFQTRIFARERSTFR